MASKDGKIFDTIVYIGLGVNGLTALYLLLMYFEVILFRGRYHRSVKCVKGNISLIALKAY